MTARLLATTLLMLVLAGCGQRTAPAGQRAESSAPAPAGQSGETSQPVERHPQVGPGFAGVTWRVTKSNAVAIGSRYEFRTDGVLRITAPGSTPSEGRWEWESGKLTMVEEGIRFPVDILALDDSTFRTLSHNPGEPVEMTMVRDN